MAFYVLLVKESETDHEVVYRFGPEECRMGRIRLQKEGGEVDELAPVPDPQSRAIFNRAAYKLAQHWEQGIYPERTSWAS